MPHLDLFWTLPEMVPPALPWADVAKYQKYQTTHMKLQISKWQKGNGHATASGKGKADERTTALMMKIGLEQQKQIQLSRETPETRNMQNKKNQFCPLYVASTSSTQPLGSTQKTSSQTELRRRFSYAWMAQAAESFSPSPDGSAGKYRRKHQQA